MTEVGVKVQQADHGREATGHGVPEADLFTGLRVGDDLPRADRCPALAYSGKITTYQQLAANIARVVLVLRRAGIVPTSRLALLLPDSPTLVTYTLAAFRLNATVLPLAAHASAEDLELTLLGHGTRVLITSDEKPSYAMAAMLVGRGVIERVIVVAARSQGSLTAALRLRLLGANRVVRVPFATSPAFLREADLVSPARGAVVGPLSGSLSPVSEGEPGDPALLSMIVACVNPPAPLSHRALMANVEQILGALPPLAARAERFFLAAPLSDPLVLNLATGLARACAAELYIPQSLSPADLVRTFNAARPTVILAAPVLLASLLDHGRLDLRALRHLTLIVTLGPGLTGKALRAIRGRTQACLVQTYAVPAAAVVVATARLDAQSVVPDHFTAVAGTRFAVRDLADQRRDVPPGERGRLFVAGPQIAAPATAPTASPSPAFVATGDIGVLDEAGAFSPIDGVAETIVTAGYLIYPSRIEAALLEHPAVIGAAVIGVGDDRRGTVPKAFVILSSAVPSTEGDLRQHLASRVSKIEMPADFEFVRQLPLTPFGTIDKGALRRDVAAKAALPNPLK